MKLNILYVVALCFYVVHGVAEQNMNRPGVGVAVLLVKDNKVLLGMRKNSHGEGTWAPPGGHLEYGESFENCAVREVLEETGLHISDPYFYAVTNDVFENEAKHYVTVFMMVHEIEGQLELLEPEKCESWQWFDIGALPSNLFLPFSKLVKGKIED